MAFQVASLLAVEVGSVFPSAPVAAAQGKAGQGKLHPDLVRLEQLAATGSVDAPHERAGGVIVAGDSVNIFAVPAGTARALSRDLNRLGLQNGASISSFVTGRLPIDSISRAEELASLNFMRPDWVFSSSGPAWSQGDPAMYTDAVRSTFSVDGYGVPVGVMSDSFDCLGGAASGVASDELPAAGVTVVGELSPCTSGTDEGRAMAEIVHDVAPGSPLLFRTGFMGQADFAKGVKDLAAAGAKVIVDDVSYAAEPMFQDGVTAVAAANFAKKGVFLSSAGNVGSNAYEQPFRDSGVECGVIGPSGPAHCHDFDPGPGVDEDQRVTLPPNSTTGLTLQWKDPFGTHADTKPPIDDKLKPKTDLDFAIFNADGSFIFRSQTDNINATFEPLEFISITNNNAVPSEVDLQIERYAGPEPSVMRWVAMFSQVTIDEFDTASPTAFGHANAGGVLSVGASVWYNTPYFGTDPPILESFSSAGGVPILFSSKGKALKAPVIRQTPDFTGPDGGNTSFFGTDIVDDADAQPNFFGTSAAAPHVAGLVALILAYQPKAKLLSVCNALANSALDMTGTVGYDHASGFGLVSAPAAFAYLSYSKTVHGPCHV